MRELFTTYPTQLLGGGLLVLLGILVRFFPNLIAGYNTMSAEQKKNVDVKGLSRFMCLSLAAIGIGWIALGMLAGNLGGEKWVLAVGFQKGLQVGRLSSLLAHPEWEIHKVCPVRSSSRRVKTCTPKIKKVSEEGRKMPHTLQPFLILGVQVLTRRGEDRMGHTLCISQSG